MRGGLEYRLGSPMSGFDFKPERDFRGYSIHLGGPHMSVIFYWKDNRYAKKTPPAVKPSNFVLFPVDKVDLLGKDQIREHVKKIAEEGKFNVDTETALGTIDEAFKELESYLGQLK